MVGISYDRAELKELKLEKSNGGRYFLNATYEYENKNGIYELNIPYIELPVCTYGLPAYRLDFRDYGQNELNVDLGFGELRAWTDHKTGMTHRIKEIEKKTRKMTLAEIEAQLGHKIELISE